MIIPTGWRILVEPRQAPTKSAGGIIFTDLEKDIKSHASAVAKVVAIGDEAYVDKDKYKDPWVNVGDWIMIGKYAGHAFKENGKEYRILNDDEVIAIVSDPDTISA